MALIKIGVAKAHIPAVGNAKSRYVTCGALFQDPDTERLVLKLDSIPVGGWQGWVNIFGLDDRPADRAPTEPDTRNTIEVGDDDIPF